MSPQYIVSPDELERFAYALRSFTALISTDASQLQSQFESLGQTWRDQEHEQFAEEFEQMMRVLQNFTQKADEHIPNLLRRAQLIREYLDSK